MFIEAKFRLCHQLNAKRYRCHRNNRFAGEEIWPLIAKVLSCERIAQKGSIASNGYRTPQVCMLLGQDSWVEHVDNGIRYVQALVTRSFRGEGEWMGGPPQFHFNSLTCWNVWFYIPSFISRYTYDVTKCMFSSGNVTEKLRVSRFHCESETVVDLYAGRMCGKNHNNVSIHRSLSRNIYP